MNGRTESSTFHSRQGYREDERKSISEFGLTADPADTVQRYPPARPLLGKSREAPRHSWLKSSQGLSFFSVILHSALVAIHLILVAIWRSGREQRLVFSLGSQKIVSFLISAIATTFGTIYLALLVFVTQTLSQRRSLRITQALTATHDNSVAWAGVGSAISSIWNQRASPSTSASLSAVLYLGSILVLHITTPALFSLETFTSPNQVLLTTEGLPVFNFTGYNISEPYSPTSALFSADDYASGSLYFLPSITGSTTNVGLRQGTLYDVISTPNAATNDVTVDATGFNITCGYVAPVGVMKRETDSDFRMYWNATSPYNSTVVRIPLTQPGMIITLQSVLPLNNAIVLYSTTPIIDSTGNTNGAWSLEPPMQVFSAGIDSSSVNVSSVQVLQCSQTLIKQTAIVDAQSRQLLSVEPDIHKTSSAWLPSVVPPKLDFNLSNPENNFLNYWSSWYPFMPDSPLVTALQNGSALSVGDMYLIQKLNLLPLNGSFPNETALHDVENALSEIVAAMFWTLGHISPLTQLNSSADFVVPEVPSNAPILLQGQATATGMVTQIRLNLSIIAVSAGLIFSAALFLLSLQYLQPRSHNKQHGTEVVPVDGTGLLQAIWLYRNHPELETLLEQVEYPTDENLRKAGMVETRLVGMGRVF
ncbi:hypothetical protein K438DRAFT_1814717 [Mycena galopus ATCC 62051]|nr:hypothetical protein K438DRAFT_1814717 [Mycena galopus ATCC 62051]